MPNALKKVCHISTAHELYDTRIFYKECYALKDAGYTVHIVINHDTDDVIDGIVVKALKRPGTRFERAVKSSLIALVRALKTGSGIYHFHDSEFIPAGLILKLLGKKVIYDVHEDLAKDILDKEWVGNIHFRRIVSFFADKVEKFGAFFFDGIVGATDGIAGKFSRRKTISLRNYPIISLIDQTPTVKVEKAKPVVFYAGALTRIRGIKEIVQAMEFVGPRAELWLLGEWENDAYMSDCMSQKGWEHTRYLGYKRMDEAYGYYTLADVGMVNFYPIENHLHAMPNKAFEYMTFKIPMVLSNFAFWQETFRNCALFVDPNDPKDIADKIVSVLTDSSLGESLSQEARRLIDKVYSWEAESTKLTSLYNRLSGDVE